MLCNVVMLLFLAQLPDPVKTPGEVMTRDRQVICKPGYATTVRHVTKATKRAVYQRYGISCKDCAKRYEVDHLIPLELGGANTILNLWPQPYKPTPGAHEKDKVEQYLHAHVCSGEISLHVAQEQIAKDWLKIYEGLL